MRNKCKCFQAKEESTQIQIIKNERSYDIRKQLISERKLNGVQGYFQSIKCYKEYNSLQNTNQKFELSYLLQEQVTEEKKSDNHNILQKQQKSDYSYEKLEMILVNKFGKMVLFILESEKKLSQWL
ncbi:unnamed protein product [Paramecium sonneborni]|uniref:Uncharacterized protein n=1 Tax=Paramecium sonneborni TaxID=65129 RepID=A0A8S1P8Y5_9CILI|nr:unnamed protein product [Paramecium sonneborni]